MRSQVQPTQVVGLPTRAVLYGGTGQAKVTREILKSASIDVVLVVDDTKGIASPFADVPLVEGLAGLRSWMQHQRGSGNVEFSPMGFCVSIGNPHGRARLRIAQELTALGLVELSAIHPSAVISPSASLGPGAQVMAGAIVQACAIVGRQCIINTRASIDHDCVIGDGCGVAPGATLCGEIRCGDNVWIGAGATVLPRIQLGADSIIGAGAVVTRDVSAATTVVGVPAAPAPTA